MCLCVCVWGGIVDNLKKGVGGNIGDLHKMGGTLCQLWIENSNCNFALHKNEKYLTDADTGHETDTFQQNCTQKFLYAFPTF